jgi:hypothetical protein
MQLVKLLEILVHTLRHPVLPTLFFNSTARVPCWIKRTQR